MSSNGSHATSKCSCWTGSGDAGSTRWTATRQSTSTRTGAACYLVLVLLAARRDQSTWCHLRVCRVDGVTWALVHAGAATLSRFERDATDFPLARLSVGTAFGASSLPVQFAASVKGPQRALAMLGWYRLRSPEVTPLSSSRSASDLVFAARSPGCLSKTAQLPVRTSRRRLLLHRRTLARTSQPRLSGRMLRRTDWRRSFRGTAGPSPLPVTSLPMLQGMLMLTVTHLRATGLT